MSDAIISQGTKLEVKIGAVFTNVAEAKNFGGLGGGEAADIDVTHLKSTAKEFKQGLPDEGTVTFQANYIPGDPGQAELRAARAAQASREFKITFSDGSNVTFTAFVKTFERNVEADGVVMLSSSLRVTGALTEA